MRDKYNRTVIITGLAIVVLIFAGLIVRHLLNRGSPTIESQSSTPILTLGGQQFSFAGLIAHNLLDRGPSAIGSQLPTVTAIIGGQQFNLEVATTVPEQEQGLSNRASLGENDGMLFRFNSPGVQDFWMINMEFPIDLIWINGDKIIGFEKNMPTPAALGVTNTADLPTYLSPGLADNVIEINSGLVAKLGLKVGGIIQVNQGN